MRTLRFRAWLKSPLNQSMAIVRGARWSESGVLERIHTDMGTFDADECIIMQSTGILDSNGKEIWEGDIVQTKHGIDFTVIYDEDRHCFRLVSPEVYFDYPDITGELTITGNIYESEKIADGTQKPEKDNSTFMVPFDFSNKDDRKAIEGIGFKHKVSGRAFLILDAEKLYSSGDMGPMGEYSAENLFNDYIFVQGSHEGLPVGKEVAHERS